MGLRKILAISGSARTASTNEKILQHIAVAEEGKLSVEIYPSLADLPIFTPDRDRDGNAPEVILELRRKIAEADGLLICTPEYVFSPPAAIKNLLEWMVSVTVLTDKPTALIVAATAGERTMESLTVILNTLGAKSTNDTRLLIQGARAKIKTEIDGDTAVGIQRCISEMCQMIDDRR